MIPARLAISMALIAAGCASPSHPEIAAGAASGIEVESGRDFDVALGQEARVRGTSISIRFVEVSNESRCPSDVQCVWAGNAVVKLSLAASGAASSGASLNTTLEPRSVVFAGYRVTLTSLRPYPRSGTTIPQAAYVATLEVRAIQGG
jgi:hypothetical protein